VSPLLGGDQRGLEELRKVKSDAKMSHDLSLLVTDMGLLVTDLNESLGDRPASLGDRPASLGTPRDEQASELCASMRVCMNFKMVCGCRCVKELLFYKTCVIMC
jgi:hypothetical protein